MGAINIHNTHPHRNGEWRWLGWIYNVCRCLAFILQEESLCGMIMTMSVHIFGIYDYPVSVQGNEISFMLSSHIRDWLRFK